MVEWCKWCKSCRPHHSLADWMEHQELARLEELKLPVRKCAECGYTIGFDGKRLAPKIEKNVPHGVER